MNTEDDPEARIRELERPLAETAQASEAGGSQPPGGYTYQQGPAVPPPSPYGESFPWTSQRSPSSNRIWWMLAAFFVIGSIALAGAIVSYSAHKTSQGGGFTVLPPTPSNSPMRPSTTASGIPTSSAASSSVPIPPAGANLSVSGISENRTIACNGNTVSVSGISNVVVITGHCASLTVSGVRNSVTVDAVDTIEAAGFNNQITYHTGTPSIDKSGESNTVQQG